MPDYLLTDHPSVSPLQYWLESANAWRDFTQDTNALWMSSLKGIPLNVQFKITEPIDGEITTRFAHILSDFNTRHWNNTIRFWYALPGWMYMRGTNSTASMKYYQKEGQVIQNTICAEDDTLAASPPANSLFDDQPDGTTESPLPPKGLAAPDGTPDDLTRIKGIGPTLCQKLNNLGIYHFRQIAHWSDEDVLWVDEYLSFKGRIDREQWIAQAQSL